jgi:2-polyprenyl-6-methoxyphenol hydroxylase-like FAD-dependent oxidoreductase
VRLEGKSRLILPAASRTIIVAGAGIGGLTAALALARQQFRVVVLERSEQLEEVGAGIQLSPNASRILIELGVEKHLEQCVVVPDDISVAGAYREIVRIPIGGNAAFRYGAPYWVMHRADLQAALLARVREVPDVALMLGTQLEDFAVHSKGVTVVTRRGVARLNEQARGLIGADGVWSTVRSRAFAGAQPKFSGYVAWRGTVATSALPREFTEPRVRLWLGRDAHLVAYPLRGGQRINVVAIGAGDWNRPGWSEAGDPREIARLFEASRWPPTARWLIGAVEEWRRWALFEVATGEWCKGPVALLGDAAHAMLPFAAQGAAMAIEDAAVLAQCLAQEPNDIDAALIHYAAKRRPRIARMRRAAQQNGRIYHMGGPMAFARNATMRLLGGSRLMARQDWIYDWRAA